MLRSNLSVTGFAQPPKVGDAERYRLTDTLGRIADHKITKLDELMPWSYAQH